ncbi:hypothetical protein BV25DRAFT_1582379 [Artomyces pyxidatus]|uniref:Uncharacterized protein n=1 Tax=Artomyces pyxidatus TaxID=48021 RepID=A0ACB8TAV9_9AGAM|nr:hypothetical protein BV25DRAFT_1582379 [Artomyces pyxidatus]
MNTSTTVSSIVMDPSNNITSSTPAIPPSTPLAVPWFTESFWSRDPTTAAARKMYGTILLVFTALVIICILSALPVYWGALWQTTSHVHNLKGWVVDFDGSTIGKSVSQGVMSTSGSPSMMTWEVVPATLFPDGLVDVESWILEEKIWVIIAISENATAGLQAAVLAANASYVSNATITAVVAEARSENAYKNIIRPIITGILDGVTASLNAHVVQTTAESGQNLTILAKSAPTLLTQPVSYTISNLRPFDVPVAAAVDFVGLIYLLILAFIITMVNYAARVEMTHLQDRLSFVSLLAMRILVPLTLYFPISLFYALLSQAFQVPFDRKFGHSGFLIYWMMSWFAMGALGLALESAVTLLTTKFVGFFLLLWVVANVSVCFFPPELLPGVFRYAPAMPFYNVQQAVRTIVFDTKNQLGLNFGVQLAWMGVSICTITVFQYFKRYRAIREHERPRDTEKRGGMRELIAAPLFADS